MPRINPFADFDGWMARRRQIEGALAKRLSRALARGRRIEEGLSFGSIWSMAGVANKAMPCNLDRPFVAAAWTPEYLGAHLARRAIGWGASVRIL